MDGAGLKLIEMVRFSHMTFDLIYTAMGSPSRMVWKGLLPERLTEKEGGQYQRHVIQPRLRDNDGTGHVDRYHPAAICQSQPAFAQ